MTNCIFKIVVFDLDETLGYFMELGMFWDALKEYIKHKQIKQPINQSFFNTVLDLYPEFLRPNILNILNYLKKKKENNLCGKLIIYTNNQGPIEWAEYIIKYFEEKIDYKIFDQIIAAFKVRGKRVELCRTTHLKNHTDLIKCSKLPENTQICFLDDVFYPDMDNKNIYYINIKPYVYDLDFDEMITRFLNCKLWKSSFLSNNSDEVIYFRHFMLTFMKRYNYNNVIKNRKAYNLDKSLSKRILHHLHIFFKMKPLIPNTNKTKRNKYFKNRTLKKKRRNHN
jgi:hypothetical protein